ncbi:unnamed protein product [Phaedon cochleariae]|uniref:Homeobox domain-containing protein n=1 Tax=Phaedon cochleariae TaxID=80249 RepID=A0A9P0DRJ8_PHACE|nr:unnamed protein product [Phaedon cochleariae]
MTHHIEDNNSIQRNRTCISRAQTNILQQSFEENPFGNKRMKVVLATLTGLPIKVINKWFQNRRREKRCKEKKRGHLKLKNHNCCKSFDMAIRLIAEINRNVKNLRKSIGNVQGSNMSGLSSEEIDVITGKIPCQSIEELVVLENLIETDTNARDLLIYILHSVGGLSGKDFTQRIMRRLLTNDLALLCSWTGAKKNFELQKLRLMECTYSAIIKQIQISRKEFEIYVKDWLRHAKQRKEREDLKRNK